MTTIMATQLPRVTSYTSSNWSQTELTTQYSAHNQWLPKTYFSLMLFSVNQMLPLFFYLRKFCPGYKSFIFFKAFPNHVSVIWSSISLTGSLYWLFFFFFKLWITSIMSSHYLWRYIQILHKADVSIITCWTNEPLDHQFLRIRVES